MYDPKDEVRFRRRLAEGFLTEAERSLSMRDWRGVVSYSQLAVENAAKAIIALFRAPSWSHDPSRELLDVKELLPPDARSLADKLANIAHELAPEHGRTTYGDPSLGLTPWDLYSEDDAKRCLAMAKKAIEIMKTILAYYKLNS
ncbi:MAG: DNA-binding protein [Thermoprotei archaeon]|nr:MAG: DNA-binding protein [Thermoprotei archaeon]